MNGITVTDNWLAHEAVRFALNIGLLGFVPGVPTNVLVLADLANEERIAVFNSQRFLVWASHVAPNFDSHTDQARDWVRERVLATYLPYGY